MRDAPLPPSLRAATAAQVRQVPQTPQVPQVPLPPPLRESFPLPVRPIPLHGLQRPYITAGAAWYRLLDKPG